MSTQLPLTLPPSSYDTIDVRQILMVIRRRALLIAATTLFAATLALLHVMFAVPQFTATGMLYLGDAQNGGSAGDSSGLPLSTFSDNSDVQTQIELITAGALVENAILETGLNAKLTPAGTPKLTYWRWRFYHGGQTNSFVPGADSLKVRFASTPGSYKLEMGKNNDYTVYSETTLFRRARPILHGVLGQAAAGNGVSMLVEAASTDYRASPGKIYDLKVVSPVALASAVQGGALTVIAGGLAVAPTKNAKLQFLWNDPYQAQLFVNQVMKDYIGTQLAWQTQSASTTEDFVSTQLKTVSAALAKADENLGSYQAKTGIVDVPQNAQTIISQLTAYQQQRATAQLQRDSLKQIAANLQQPSARLNPYLVGQASDAVPADLVSSLSAEQVKLSELRAQFTDAAHDVQVEEAKVAEIKSAIRDTVQNAIAADDKRISNLDQMIATLEGQLKELPAESLKVASLQRSADVLGQLYVQLMQKQEEAQLSKAATIINTRIVTPSNLPLAATSPKLTITVLFGALVGLAGGIALAFGQRTFSGRFESEEQIRLIARVPVHGTIPRRTKAAIAAGFCDAIGHGPFFEAFRLLRASIARMAEPGKPMTILIISASKSDGKTTVATNLAKSLADSGKQVVLVDGDLHLSRLKALQPHTHPGLIGWMQNGKRPEIDFWPGEKFKLLAAGAAEEAGSINLDGERLGAIFTELKSQFDFIVIDSPPLPTVSDGLLLGEFADLILSVVSVSNTTKRSFATHNELIETLDRPHGIIINGVENESYEGKDAYFLNDAISPKKFIGRFKMNLL